MVIHEYGSSLLPRVLLLHPMLADAGCMRVASDSMKGDYCFIIPDFSAHGEDTGVYQSGKKEAAGLLDYLKAKGYTDIALMMGASMGGMIGLYLLGDGSLKIGTAVFEGASAYPGSWLLCKLVQSVFLRKHRKAVGMPPDAVEKMMAEQYGEAFGAAMARNFQRMDEESIKAVVYDCSHVYFPVLSPEMQKRMFWAVGDKDMNYLQLKNVRRRYPHMNVIVQKGYDHCAYMAEHYREYGALLERYMEQNRGKQGINRKEDETK